MSNVKPPSESETTDEINQEDILTFTREVPSPLAVPRTSILKRKHPETVEEGMSPCAKVCKILVFSFKRSENVILCLFALHRLILNLYLEI